MIANLKPSLERAKHRLAQWIKKVPYLKKCVTDKLTKTLVASTKKPRNEFVKHKRKSSSKSSSATVDL